MPGRTIPDHYDVLGVAPTAPRDEIRQAYRRLARTHHPDASGELGAERMADINQAWRVLGDAGRRAVYDSQRATPAGTTSSAAGGESAGSQPQQRTRPAASSATRAAPAANPASFPWRFLLGIAVAGIAFVLVNAALTKPADAPAVDNLLDIGSCVAILDNGDAQEVLCGGEHDGVVTALRPANNRCPSSSELHRDRQGMGAVCVRLTSN